MAAAVAWGYIHCICNGEVHFQDAN